MSEDKRVEEIRERIARANRIRSIAGLSTNDLTDLAFLLAELDKARRSEPPRREAEQRVRHQALMDAGFEVKRGCKGQDLSEPCPLCMAAVRLLDMAADSLRVEKAPPAQEGSPRKKCPVYPDLCDGKHLEDAPPAPQEKGS